MAKRFHNLIYLSLVPTVGGVMLASWTEAEYEVTGFWAALLASVITAAITVVSGILLVVKLDSINLLHLMAPMAFIMLLPVTILTGEGYRAIFEWYPKSSTLDITVLVISGVIAFLLNITTFLVIGATSALSFNIAGNFKVILSIIFSVLIFHTSISFLNGLGITIALAGVAYYNYITKALEPPKPPVEIVTVSQIEEGTAKKGDSA